MKEVKNTLFTALETAAESVDWDLHRGKDDSFVFEYDDGEGCNLLMEMHKDADVVSIIQENANTWKENTEPLQALAKAVSKIRMFQVPVTWQVSGTLGIWGSDAEDAVANAEFEEEHGGSDGCGLPLPDGEYLSGSFTIDNENVYED